MKVQISLLLCWIVFAPLVFLQFSDASRLGRDGSTAMRSLSKGGRGSWRGGDTSNRYRTGARWERIDSSDPRGETKKACNFYLWNFPSAFLHHWCHFLAHDCIYEGRGGVKFARIPPGSMLQLLWPCSKYSTDSCVFCGGKFKDHLELSWSRNLYTPIDVWLDRTSEQGKIIVPVRQVALSERSIKKVKSKKSEEESSTKHNYAFHRLYVREADTAEESPKKARLQKKKTNTVDKSVEWRDSSRFGAGARGVSYAIPTFSREERAGKPVALSLAWYIVLDALDKLIGIESMENNSEKNVPR